MFRNFFLGLVTSSKQSASKVYNGLERKLSTLSVSKSKDGSNEGIDQTDKGLIPSDVMPLHQQSIPGQHVFVSSNVDQHKPLITSPITTTATLSFTTAVTTTYTTCISTSAFTTPTLPSYTPSLLATTAAPPVSSQSFLPPQQPMTSHSHSTVQETAFLEILEALLSRQLPQLDIKKFGGDRKLYEPFKSRFCTLITSCNVIPSQRATLLYNALTEDVTDQLDHIYDLQKPDAYEELWNSLDREFSQKGLDVISHVTELSTIQAWDVCETSSDLYKLYQFLRYHYNALKRLGQEREAEVSKLHVLGKLTGDIVDKCFSLGLFDPVRDKPVMPEMLSLIRYEVDILKLQEIAKETSKVNIKNESSSGDGVHLPDQSQSVNTFKPHVNDCNLHSKTFKQLEPNGNSYVRSKPVKNVCNQGMLSTRESKAKCIFCHSNQHESHFCKYYRDPADSRKILFRYGLCFNCLGHGHRSWECVEPKICAKRCGDSRKHSPVLCHTV